MAAVVSEKSKHKAAAMAWFATTTKVDIGVVANNGEARTSMASGFEMDLMLESQRRPDAEHTAGAGEVVMLTPHSTVGDTDEVINFKG